MTHRTNMIINNTSLSLQNVRLCIHHCKASVIILKTNRVNENIKVGRWEFLKGLLQIGKRPNFAHNKLCRCSNGLGQQRREKWFTNSFDKLFAVSWRDKENQWRLDIFRDSFLVFVFYYNFSSILLSGISQVSFVFGNLLESQI